MVHTKTAISAVFGVKRLTAQIPAAPLIEFQTVKFIHEIASLSHFDGMHGHTLHIS